MQVYLYASEGAASKARTELLNKPGSEAVGSELVLAANDLHRFIGADWISELGKLKYHGVHFQEQLPPEVIEYGMSHVAA